MTDKKYIPTQYNAPNLLFSIDKFIGKFQWIRVEDRLPEVGKDVLLFLSDELDLRRYDKVKTKYGIGVFDGIKFYAQLPKCECEAIESCFNILELKEVSHWMELPEPPKENNE